MRVVGRWNRWVWALLVVVLAVLLAGCPRTKPPPENISVEVAPASVTLAVSGEAEFTASVSGTDNDGVDWSSSSGTVVGSGSSVTYVAPGEPGSYTLTATSVQDDSKSASASIEVVETLVYSGDSVVETVADGDGRVVVESESLGVAFEIRVEDEGGSPVAGAPVAYFEDDDGNVVVVSEAPYSALAPSFFIGNPSDLGVTGSGESAALEPQVIPLVIAIPVLVVATASILNDIRIANAATREINATVTEEVINCSGSGNTGCACMLPSEVAALFTAQAERRTSLIGIGVTGATTGLGMIAGVAVGDAAELGVGLVGVAVDTASLSGNSVLEVRSDLERLHVETGEFDEFGVEEPMQVVFLDYAPTYAIEGGALDYHWGGVILTGESCDPSNPDPIASSGLDVQFLPNDPPNGNSDLTVQVSTDPPVSDAVVHLTLETAQQLAPTLRTVQHGYTNGSGVAEFRVSGYLGRPGATAEFAVASYEAGQAVIDSFVWADGPMNASSPVLELRPLQGVRREGSLVELFYAGRDNAASFYDIAGFGMESCVIDWGDGSVEDLEECRKGTSIEDSDRRLIGHRYSQSGVYEVELSGLTSDGRSASISRFLQIEDAASPEVTSFGLSASEVETSESVRATWSVFDADDDDNQCILDPDVTVVGHEQTGDCDSFSSFSFDQVDAGWYQGHLMVMDGRLGSARRPFRYLVVPPGSEQPVADVAVGSIFAAPGDVVQIDASTSFDPDGGDLTYRFGPDGIFFMEQASPFGGVAFDTTGVHGACVQVIDDEGQSAEACASVSVVDASGAGSVNGYMVTDPYASEVEFSVSALDGSGVVIPSGVISGVSVTNVSRGTATARTCGDIQPYGPKTADLVLDGSSSLGSADPGLLRNDAAKRFVDRMLVDDLAAVASFNGSFTRHQGLTADSALLYSAVDAATYASGGTAIWNAVSSSAAYLASDGGSNDIIVLFTDGRDGGGGYAQAVADAQAAGARVFTVGLGSSLDYSELQAIATATGGVFANAADASELTALFDSLFNAATADGCIAVDFDPYAGLTTAAVDLEVSFTLNFSVDANPYNIDSRVFIPDPASLPISVTIEPDAAELLPGESASFTATVGGTDDPSVTWSATCGSASGTGSTVTYVAPSTAATCTLAATSVTDPLASAAATIQVSAHNSPPAIAVFSASPSSVTTGEAVTFSWSVSDPDGDPLSCSLDVDADGTSDYSIGDCVSTTSQAYVYTTSGSYNPILRVSDGQGGQAQASTSVTADAPNSPPTIANFSASPSTTVAGETVTFSWGVNDHDGDALGCTLDVEGDGAIEYSIATCTTTTSQTHSYSNSGQYAPVLRVSDRQGGHDEATTSVTVDAPNSPPTLGNFSASPSTVVVGEPVTFSWSVSDAEGDPLRCYMYVTSEWDSFLYTFSDCSGMTTQTHEYVEAGEVVPRLVVLDDQGGRTVGNVDVSVIPNGVPTVESFSWTRESDLVGEPVIFQLAVSDPEGHALQCSMHFGDPSSQIVFNECRDSHWSFEEAGSYTPVIIVFDDFGAETQLESTDAVEVSVGGRYSFATIAAGGRHSLALDSRGIGWAWGYDGEGQIGNGYPYLDGNVPLTVSMPSDVILADADAGISHSVALDATGYAWAWGGNEFGQLGNGDGGPNEYRDLPAAVTMPAGVRFASISAGRYHSLAVDTNGNAWAWGRDNLGQLGDGGLNADQFAPVPVTMPAGVTFVSVAAGGTHSIALDAEGDAWAWGSDQSGSLGNGGSWTDSDTPVPVSMPTATTFSQVSASWTHSLALDTAGRAWGWGSDYYGELGDGVSTSYAGVPVLVSMPLGTAFVEVSAGYLMSLALDENGRAWAWGRDDLGQLGDGGSNADQVVPVPVATPIGVVFRSIAAGGRGHSLALDVNGGAWAWGIDGNGRLGDGRLNQDSSIPKPVLMP